jgi:hypothetical protein
VALRRARLHALSRKNLLAVRMFSVGLPGAISAMMRW